ncbi:MAG: potassium channel protein [Gammaproteobacteria bacterium]|nr:potassium channel protein [Gammaproteobacteria bacterium]
MKYLASMLAAVQRGDGNSQNFRLLLTYLAFLLALIVVYSVLFHVLMTLEGQQHSWLTGVYWTLTVMSTLGFGDITFTSDAGRMFSIVVLLSGIVSLLVVLPFVFIEFFYVPFLKAQSRARVPRVLPARVSGHVIITNFDPVTKSLVEKLDNYGYPYVLLAGDPEAALSLTGRGYQVIVGAPDDPATYLNARIAQASLVVATGGEMGNTNIAFTVREIAPSVRIVATVRDADAIEVLELAGCSRVLMLGDMLGSALARRTLGGDARAHVIGEFGDLVIAEASAYGTPLVGKTLAETRVEQLVGMRVVGIWERGAFTIAMPTLPIHEATVLVMAGTMEQVRRYDAMFCIYHVARGRILILGSGRVGRATAEALAERGAHYCLVDRDPDRQLGEEHFVLGNATDRGVLDRAGIADAPAILVTTHDDDINIYLTIYVRKLRPDAQVISRATYERNVSTLHRAGADFVMSYANMGASAIFNYLERGDVLMLAEGLNVSRIETPAGLIGRSAHKLKVLDDSGCHLVAVGRDKVFDIHPGEQTVLQAGDSLVIVGSMENEKRFLAQCARL